MNLSAPSRLDAALPPSVIRPEDPVAIDFETYYDDECSVSSLSYWHYTHHPKFRAYMVSVFASDVQFVGDPKDFDWSRIRGRLWVSHNKSFDEAVFNRLVELGVVHDARTTVTYEGVYSMPPPRPAYWGDSACLSVFLRAPRALAGAMQALYGVTRSKELRNRDMKGKTWEQYGPDLQQKILAYALTDAQDCRQIWVDHAHKWPAHERRIADLLQHRGAHGMHIDQDGLAADIQMIEQIKFQAEQKIPWRHEYTVLSRVGVIAECRKHGIEPPKSFAMADEECVEWEDQYGEKFPWVAAVRDWRRANALLSKYKAIRDRIKPDGRVTYSLLYGGAHTMRTSGSGGLNMLNLARNPFYYTTDWNMVHRKEDITAIDKHKKDFKCLPDWTRGGIDMRSKFVAAPGKKLTVGDLAQIEARAGRWLAGDHATLRLVEEGYGIYVAHAKRFMGWKGGDEMKKADAPNYNLAKARELALSFGVGHAKFEIMAHNYVDDAAFNLIFGATTTEDDRVMYLEYVAKLRNPTIKATYARRYKNADEFTRNVIVNSWLQVADFRAKNPELTSTWRRLDDELKRSIGEDYEVTLPNGSTITYFNVTQLAGDGIQVRTERGGPFHYYHGAKIFENLVQKTAREVFVEAQLRVDDAGIPIVLDVYDELVCETDEDFDPNMLLSLMTERPKWARSLPIGAEVETMHAYRK